MSRRPIIFSSAFKRQNALYYSGVLFSNWLIYMILVRALQFYIASELPLLFTAKVLMGQVLLWSLLKVIRVESDDNQKLSSNWFVLGGVLGSVLGGLIQVVYGLPNIFELGLLGMGHIFFQNIFWTELSTTAPNDRKLMVVRILTMSLFSFLVYLTDFKSPVLLAWCGMMAMSHIFVRGLTTGISQIWLIYNEEVIFKSHYHQIVKTNRFQHIASDTSQSMGSSLKNNLVFMLGSIGAGFVIISFMATSFAKTAYVHFTNAFVGLIEWLFGDLMKNLFEFLLRAQQNLKPQKQTGFGGVAKEITQKSKGYSNLAKEEQAADLLTVVFGVILVAIIVTILVSMAKKQVNRIQRQMRTNKDVRGSHFEQNGFFSNLLKALDVKAQFKKGQLDLFRRKYKKLLEGFMRMGMVVERSDTPSELVEKMICYLPEELERLKKITEVYNALRYGEVKTATYSEALTELNQLIKQVRKGVSLR